MYKHYTRKQEFVIITFILLLAVFSTYFIYNKFTQERKVDYDSEKLEIVFNEKNGEKVLLDKITPLIDNVGLSTKSYNFDIKNNLTEDVKIKIKLIDDIEEISNDNCESKLIPKTDIKIMIKEGNKEGTIYRLSEIEDDELGVFTIKALKNNDYSIRAWIDKDTALTQGMDMHYHGLIKVIEESTNEKLN